MACEVKIFGQIRDFRKVQEYFGLGHDDNWLNSINYAISPTGELIALAQGEKLAFLSTCWNTKNTNTYTLSWCSHLEDPNQIITSLACLPIHSRGNGTDWTCVAVGLISGMIVFYTDTGIKLFSQCCHEEPILAVKVHASPNYLDTTGLLYIVYNQCMCFIKCSDLLPLLASIRHNINRYLERNRSHSAPVLTLDVIPFHKYKFGRERETVINDAVVSTTNRQKTYDHIVSQSIAYGYFAKVNPVSAKSSQIIGVGVEPYMGFYAAEEGYKLASISEVAKDVFGMAYKNLMGNLFKRSPETPLPSPNDETSTAPTKEAQMRTHSRLYDGKRDGYTVAISPNGKLAAVTDNLDRVMLIDARRTIILRVWKGYRDAQVAFVPVKEKSLMGMKTHRRIGLFLVIYAPRLGCLDIWALQNGPKVAAFNVCKSGQLSYVTHGLLSVQTESKPNSSQISFCLFLDPSDASIKEVQIPFHYVLSETNSITSRDIHMLRQLRQSLRNISSNETANVEQIAQYAKELQTLEVRQQCLEMLLKSKKLRPEIFQCVLKTFVNDELDDATESHEESAHFRQQINNYKRLVDFYIAMRSPSTKPSDFLNDLELSDCDLVTINQLVLLLNDKQSENMPQVRKVSFLSEGLNDEEDFVEFFSIFDVTSSDCVSLMRNKFEAFGRFSNMIFGKFFNESLCFAQFKEYAQESGISCEDLLVLALHFWLDKPFNYKNCDDVIEDMSRLAAMIRAICELESTDIYNYAYNAISPWWQKVREMLLESQRSSGLLVAIVCKTVAVQLWKSHRDGSCDEGSQTEEDELWERISTDEAQWTLLIGKLENIAILGAILERPIICAKPKAPDMPYEIPDCSLKSIIYGGKGIITDLTAKWLVSTRIDPSKIVEITTPSTSEPKEQPREENKKDDTPSNPESDTSTESTSECPNPTTSEPVLEKLSLLRSHYPFSLESGVLLSLMSWHYMVYWSKNLSSLEHMRASVACLKQYKNEDLALKHGMCCMLWNATLKFPLQATMKLIQKVGRLPVGKMCQQDIEMSSGLVPDFLELVLQFLEEFNNSLEHEKRELKFEESLNDGPLALQFLALQQHHGIKELLQIQYELCTVLHFMAYFQLKTPKPVTTLFDAMTNKAFLADINKELGFTLPEPDLVLQQQRTEFLCKVVAATIDLIREDLENLYILDHVYYMAKICALADSWKLDKLPLLRRQIVELYACGYDKEAQLLIRDIADDDELGCSLLQIAGRRLILYTSCDQKRYLTVASVGRVLQYLDKLKETSSEAKIQITANRPEDIDLNALTKLVTYVYQCLRRRQTKYLNIAAQMYDACRLLQE